MQIRVGDVSTRVLDLSLRDIYADVIEGVPNAEVNASIIASAMQDARLRYRLPPQLIQPTPRPLPSHGEPKEALPRICCMARVRGRGLDPEADHAEASLVWFQAAVSTDLDPEVADSMRRLSWAEIAKDELW
jgi:hypothetical protein